MTSLAAFLTAQGYRPIGLARLASGHLVLAEARVNGQPARLFLDTGAGQTVLDLAFARKLGLPLAADSRRGAGAGGGSLAIFNATVAELTLAGSNERDVACAAMDLAHVNDGLRRRGLDPMDGVIGGDLLARGEAVIDCRQAVLYLRACAPRNP